MRVYLRYAIKETLSNLWRNRMMTIAAVLTVAVSLSLVGAALLLKQSAAQASAQWQQQGTRVIVWMQPTASQSEIGNIQTELANLPIVKKCVFFTQLQDYNEAKKLLNPAETQTLTVAEMPTSFRCVPTVPANAFTVVTPVSYTHLTL